MQCTVYLICLITQHFHHIDFTAFRPLAIETFIRRHHPECRQESFTAGHLCAYFKSSVLIVMFILGIDSSGCIGGFSRGRIDCLDRLNHQIAILHIYIIRRLHILL